MGQLIFFLAITRRFKFDADNAGLAKTVDLSFSVIIGLSHISIMKEELFLTFTTDKA